MHVSYNPALCIMLSHFYHDDFHSIRFAMKEPAFPMAIATSVSYMQPQKQESLPTLCLCIKGHFEILPLYWSVPHK